MGRASVPAIYRRQGRLRHFKTNSHFAATISISCLGMPALRLQPHVPLCAGRPGTIRGFVMEVAQGDALP